jgi:hypothetical protein
MVADMVWHARSGQIPARETAKESRFAACTSLLPSPATLRPSPKCGAFRMQPRGSPLRQTGCWRKEDSLRAFYHKPRGKPGFSQLRRMYPRIAQYIEVTPAIQPTAIIYNFDRRNRVVVV